MNDLLRMSLKLPSLKQFTIILRHYCIAKILLTDSNTLAIIILLKPLSFHFSHFVNIFSSVTLCLKEVIKALKTVQYRWFDIGIQLGIPHYKLKEFEKEDNSFAATIDYWLNGQMPL